MAGRPKRREQAARQARQASTAALESMRGPLLVGRSVAHKPRYTGPLNPPSAETLAKRAAAARDAARPVCPVCFQHKAANGTCGC